MTSTTADRRFGVNGNLAFKAPVRLATTANITLSGLQSIDGVTTVEDDRVLVKDQTTASENGIYVASTGSWTRAIDFNGNRDVVTGTAVYINAGSANAGTFYSVTTANPITIGTSSISFAVSVAAGGLAAQLASSSAGLGSDLVAVDLANQNDSGRLGGFLQYTFGRTAGEIAASVTPSNYAYFPGDIRRYGAAVDGTTDDSAAIAAADSAACQGTLGLDGATVIATGTVYFPAGHTKASSSLTYRGAPWRGEGIGVTFLDFYGSSGPLINAVGTNTDRKLLSISDMTLNGSNATGTAYGIRVGYNHRSLGALRRVRIDHFPGPAFYLAADSWIMSFYDVYMSFNAADSLFTAIYQDAAVTGALAFEWHNLVLENNGVAASGVAGGIELVNDAILNWKFFGGTWEGNYGDAEARFTSTSGLHIYGTYLETDVGSATDGIVFAGSCIASISGMTSLAGVGVTGAGVRVQDTSLVTIDQVRGDDKWPTDLAVDDTAVVNLIGEGFNWNTFTVAAGAQLRRATHKRVLVSDAATIEIDVSKGTSFYVTLGGNRTMGTPLYPSVGQRITLTIYQDGTGSRTLAFNGTWNVTWSNTGNAASTRSSIEFEYDGTYWNQVSAQSPYV